jgi:hypothetical protein
VRRRDVHDFLEAARGLIGLGEGLTPAGDDYLVGSLAILHRLAGGWPVADRATAHALVGDACRRTPSISAAFLCHAVGAQFSEPLRDLAMADTPAAARAAAVMLAGLGASSGADTLTGMRDTLAALTGDPA